jgi:mono/diheme cytochrome c family protein
MPKKSKTQPKKGPQLGARTLLSVGAVVVALCGGGLWWFNSGLRQSPDAVAAGATVSQEILAYGEEIYQANCAACHGDQGQGHALAAAPALNGSEHSWHHSDGQITDLLRNGGTQMPAVAAEWGDEDIEAVISYFKQWWSGQQRVAQRGSIGE